MISFTMSILLLAVINEVLLASAVFFKHKPSESKNDKIEKVEEIITRICPLFTIPELCKVFANAFPNTLDTTILHHYCNENYNCDTFIITGDIPAMWLRDSTNQILPYLPYIHTDPPLQSLVIGLLQRQAHSILLDPFANAFNFNSSGQGYQSDRRVPPMTPPVFEGKYELDSLNAFLKLSYWTWRYILPPASSASPVPTKTKTTMKYIPPPLTTSTTNNDDKYNTIKKLTSIFNKKWFLAIEKVINTITTMQDKPPSSATNTTYQFQRLTSIATDTLSMNGNGPFFRSCGLSRSLFRPSDDAVTFPYHIPSNMMTCAELKHLIILLKYFIENNIYSDKKSEKLFETVKNTKDIICSTLQNLYFTSSSTKTTPTIIPYEIDGYLNQLFQDDPNIPSLASLPLLSVISARHPVYQATRSFLFSENNPTYVAGRFGDGIVSGHTGRGFVWPMSIIVRAMTSDNETEIKECLQQLLLFASSTNYLIHESVNINNITDTTRPWFAWANGLFAELVLQLVFTHPSVILDTDTPEWKSIYELVNKPISLLSIEEAPFSLIGGD